MPEAAEFEALLAGLVQHPVGGLVQKLARQPGQKEARWTQLLTGEPVQAAHSGEMELAYRPVVGSPVAELERRVSELETALQALRVEVASLRATASPVLETPLQEGEFSA